MTRDYPVTSRASDLTKRMTRDAQKLPAEQIIREIFVNSIEHRSLDPDIKNTAVADVEKLAAVHLRDADGNPVFRRIWTDNSSGIPRKDMVHLLQNYGESSKPSEVFSGNHGEGAVLSGSTTNPNGLVFISKDAEHEMPYVVIFTIEEDDEGNLEAGLYSFENPDAGVGEASHVPIANADEVEYFTVDETTYSMHDVWKRAYDNPKYSGLPLHGTIVLELGTDDEDSTYVRTQRTFDSGKGKSTWEYSRWAIGEYLNQHFRRFPDNIKLFWGVPGSDFAFNFGKPQTREKRKGHREYAFKPGQTQVLFDGSKNWGYREAIGLDGTITTKTVDKDDEDVDAIKDAVITRDEMTYLDGPIPFTAEVIIRDLPDPAKARKLAFNARRYGRVFIDYHDEVFERIEGDPHHLFGVTHADAKYSVWIAIKPHQLGVQEPGAVWMASGRTELLYVDDFGASHPIPWPTLARQFRENMPSKLVEWIVAKDRTRPEDKITEEEIQKFFDRFIEETKTPPKPKTPKPKVAPAIGEADEDETREPGRGPIVNPGETHPPGDDPKKRESPTRSRRLIKKTAPEGDTGVVDVEDPTSPPPPPPAEKDIPKSPMPLWVENLSDWPEQHLRWAVIWDDPTDANEMRGQVRMNWNHWYIQEVYTKLCLDSGGQKHAAKDLVQHVFWKSVVSKIMHRRTEATKIDLNEAELDQMFSPLALSGFVMGWWDHHYDLDSGLKSIGAADYAEHAEEVA